jgi:GTPase SAR1 family protein
VTGESQNAVERGSRRESRLAKLVGDACAMIPPDRSAVQDRLARLAELADRLREQRLQIAVLGQFKRGKSTLLNALLGVPLAPMAVTPLTAIPTFIESGDGYRLRCVFRSGNVEQIGAPDSQSLGALLADRVTEERNPHNRLGLERVHAILPSTFAHGAVLIDTPGIGSSHRHNTETAHAVLSDCDAALFVVSPDPPITEAELDYVRAVRKTVPCLILVMNKIDLVDGEDRAAATEYLRRVASETAGLADAPMFCVSARRALMAKVRNDGKALNDSGLTELEHYLTTFITNENRRPESRCADRRYQVRSDRPRGSLADAA